MVNYLLLLLIWLSEIIALRQWLVCRDFNDLFHILPTAIVQLNGEITNDSGVPFFITKIFHNKIVFLISNLSKIYLQYWDIRYLLMFISLIGVIGLGIFIFYLNKKNYKKPIFGIPILFMICLPIIELLFHPRLPFVLKGLALAIPFQLASLIGFWLLLREQKKLRVKVLVWLILGISFWYLFAFYGQIGEYCFHR